MNRLELGPVAFAVCWTGVWMAHVVATAYYAIVAVVYWNLTKLYVGLVLDGYEIGIRKEYYPTVSVLHVVCAAAHAVCASHILATLFGSRLRCQLQHSQSTALCTHFWNSIKSRIRSCLQVSWFLKLRSFANHIFGNEGLLGVNGKWYGAILVAREFLELSLQTVQAYKMSKLLSSAIPTDFYTSLLIGNCWITAWIRVQLGAHAVREHFFSLLLDCVLDLVTVVGLSVVIAAPYIVNTEWTYGGFWYNVMVNDERIKQATMELQFVSVSSWSDLVSRVVFAIGLLNSLADTKILLRLKPIRKNDSGPVVKSLNVIARSRNSNQLAVGRTSVAPFPSSLRESSRSKLIRSQPRRGTSTLVSFVFVIWGSVLLVQPWGVRLPFCYFATLDCFKLGINGSVEEVDVLWRQFDRSTTETLYILNCPFLEVPSSLRGFSKIDALQIDNTSIAKWDSDAAISGRAHPQISNIKLTRIVFPNATLPQGLLSPDIPWNLKTVIIYTSNLSQLPRNLSMSWPPGMNIAIELSELDTIDESLIQLKPSHLSISGNPVQTLPAALFEIEGLIQLDISSTLLHELPNQVSTFSNTVTSIFLTNTFVTTFWDWIDPLVLRSVHSANRAIIAIGTPYCFELNLILNGNVSNFARSNASFTNYSILMKTNEFLREIQQAVLCGI